jgi:ATP-dependent Clp protease ATP-binding subunit ClpA
MVARAGLREPDKPSGCYLFTGPTGVGKTEVAKQLAKTLGIHFERVDMSEYMEKHAVSRLIGSPPGYVGFGEGGAGAGLLANAVDEHPNCILLLDEVEKAHQDVLNILLQVMDHGKMTSGTGKVIDFRNVILIMTSNAGVTGSDRNPIGFGGRDQRDNGVDESAIKRVFTPEFRNRLDAVVSFDRLQPGVMLRIVDKFLAEMDVLAQPRNVTVTATEAAREWLAERGYEPAYGARPLKRLIHDRIKTPLARLMLIGSLQNGGRAVVDVDHAGDLMVAARALEMA